MSLPRKTCIIILIVIAVCSCIALTVGLSLYFTLVKAVADIKYYTRDEVVGNCVPEVNLPNSNEQICYKRSCVWKPTWDNSPFCTFPSDFGYTVDGPVEETEAGYRINLKRMTDAFLFDVGLERLTVALEFQSDHRLRIKIGDPEGQRYEVPKEAVDITFDRSAGGPRRTNATRLYDVRWNENGFFGLRVIRRSSGIVIFDTNVPGFVFSDQYIQLTTKLSSDILYGFGEHNHRSFKHDMSWKKWTMFSRDVAPVDEWNLYGVQPFYVNFGFDRNAHGVFLLNSNAMDVVLQPLPYPGITYHVIGGILDFYIFLGPTPENVVQQYTEATGRPTMPPYWALGFQLSRWDYHNLTHVKEVVRRNREAGIPQDVQYGDIDYMESKLDFTYDRDLYDGLPEFVDELHQHGQRYIIILDHAIGSDEDLISVALNGSRYKALDDGLKSDIFIKDASGAILEGEVWPGLSFYPDFTLDTTTTWWKDQCFDFYDSSGWGVKYDALWIDMNEPSNFVQGSTTGCRNNSLNYPPFLPNVLGSDQGILFDKTICMDAVQHWGRHYDVHSLYGHSMAITTYNTLRELFPNKRPLVLTRSNFAGTQKYAAHWLGDNQSQWSQIPWSIVGMLEYSLFGFSYTGADICGFWYATTEEMCQRWMQLGAFYPFARNHNAQSWPDQDPAAFGPDMISSSRNVLLTRYKLLPFLYTLFYESHAFGNTVVRPLVNEFPMDIIAMIIDRQFLWGPSLLISPVLNEGETFVLAYFPEGRWYDYYNNGMPLDSYGEIRNLDTPLDRIQLHVRGGYIIPWQEPANTTFYSRLQPMGLTVALGNAPSYEARGNLFWDDGETFETIENGAYLLVNFSCTLEKLTLEVVVNNTYEEASDLSFETIDLWGVGGPLENVLVDGLPLENSQNVYDDPTKNTQLLRLDLSIMSDHVITWQRRT